MSNIEVDILFVIILKNNNCVSNIKILYYEIKSEELILPHELYEGNKLSV